MKRLLMVLVGCFLLFGGTLYAGEGAAGAADDGVCSICREQADELENGPVFRLPCGHWGHWSCLVEWFQGYGGHNTCPVCRGVVDFAGLIQNMRLCSFCMAPLGDSPAQIVELGCHHAFHRACAGDALLSPDGFHFCPTCHVPVERIYDLLPSERVACLFRHVGGLFALVGGAMIGTAIAVDDVVASAQKFSRNRPNDISFSSAMHQSFGAGFIGGIGLGFSFVRHDRRDFFTRIYALSQSFAQQRGRRYWGEIVENNLDLGAASLAAISLIPFAGGMQWGDISLRSPYRRISVGNLIHRARGVGHFNRDHVGNFIAGAAAGAAAAGVDRVAFGGACMTTFSGGVALGGLTSGMAFSSIYEFREIGLIIASYWRSVRRAFFHQ